MESKFFFTAGIVGMLSGVASGATDGADVESGAKAWSFLGQGFTGFGLCLNDNWQLTVGYRLRYLSGNATWSFGGGADVGKLKMRQDLSHAAEVGLTYRF